MTQQFTISARAWAGLLALALVWGFSFLAMRIALDEMGPFNVVAHRVTWAMLALWLVVWAMRLPLPKGAGVWGAFLVMGLLNNAIPFSLIAWGQQHIETGLASIINASTAIWGVFVAAMLLPDERLSTRKVIGTLLGFVGVAMAIGLSALREFDLRSMGQLAIIGSSLSYAFAGVWARKQMKGMHPTVAAAGMLTGSTILILPVAILTEGHIAFDLSPRAWGAVVYVSLFATGLAYLLYYRVLALAGSANTMLCTLLVAPVAILAGTVVPNETLPAQAYAGFAILALGLIILDGRLAARVWPQKTLAEPDTDS